MAGGFLRWNNDIYLPSSLNCGVSIDLVAKSKNGLFSK